MSFWPGTSPWMSWSRKRNGAAAKLEHYGPTLGRPYVDTLIGSK
jgi:hypothetical protein